MSLTIMTGKRKSQSSWHSYFVLWGYRVQISCRIVLPELRQFNLITMQTGVVTVLKITACRHTCKHSRLHYALLILPHQSAYNYRFFFHKIGLSHQRPTSSSNGVGWSWRPTNSVGGGGGGLRLRQVATTLEISEAQTNTNNVGKIWGSEK